MKKLLLFVIMFLITQSLFGSDPGLVRVRGETVVTVSAPAVTVTVSGSSSSSSSSSGGGAGGSILIAGVSDSSAQDVTFGESDLALSASQAGKTYKMTESSDYTGTTNPAITITANDVTIDLDGRTLRASGGGTNIHAIKVNAGIKNARIKNGFISGFSGSGIYAVGTSGNEIENITVINISADANKAGLTFDYLENGNIILTKATGNTFATGTVAGFSTSNSSGVKFDTCEAYYNNATSGACYGFLFDTPSECVINNCIARGNTGTGEVAGFYITSATNYNLITDCKAQTNTSSAGAGHGYLFKSSAQIVAENNTAINNKATGGGQISYGFRLESASNCYLLKNKSDQQNYGFYDDEASGSATNIFTGNKAHLNSTSDYSRPNSSPLNYFEVNAGFLQRGLVVSELDNLSITAS